MPSEGRACRVRSATFDNLFRFGGHDERAPPTFGATRLSRPLLGGTCLSGPPNCV
jgi:hypothetical protein